jgi:hypothetical protein
MKFMNIVYLVIFFVVGAAILLTILPAILPTFYTGLSNTSTYSYCALGWNATAHTCSKAGAVAYSLPLANLFALNGILPLVLIASVFVALVIGAIALVKGGKER